MPVQKMTLIAIAMAFPVVALAQSSNPWNPNRSAAPVTAPQYAEPVPSAPAQVQPDERYAPADLETRLSSGRTYIMPAAPSAPVAQPQVAQPM